MAKQKSNTAILAIIAIALIGILGVLLLEANKKTPEEKLADSISQTVEDIGNAVAKETGKND